MDRNQKMHTQRHHPDRGFTMIEMVVVIVLTSILASAVAMFVKLPVQGFVDSARRAEMTDIADTALRRMGRDLRLALPNSVRLTDGDATIEVLLTKAGGRYRIEGDTTADELNFSISDMLFDQLGPLSTLPGQAITVNSDSVVIYNLGTGITGADAYAATADNRSLITGLPAGALANEQRIQIDAKKFPFESPGNRFQVIEGPVSYVCANGSLTRYWAYPIQATQPTAATLSALGGSSAFLATNVGSGGCVFDYSPGITARSGLVALTLIITQAGESVRLYHEVHVTNVP